MKKQSQHFEVAIPFYKTSRVNGALHIVNLFDLHICGVGYQIPDEDIDGEVSYEYEYDIDQVFFKESGSDKALEIPMLFVHRFLDISLEDDIHKPVMSYIEKLNYGKKEKEPTAWDDIYQTLGNAFGDL